MSTSDPQVCTNATVGSARKQNCGDTRGIFVFSARNQGKTQRPWEAHLVAGERSRVEVNRIRYTFWDGSLYWLCYGRFQLTARCLIGSESVAPGDTRFGVALHSSKL